MKLLLLLATLASANNLRGTTQVRANVTVAPITVSVLSPLGVTPSLDATLTVPSLSVPANAPLPTLSPAPALAAASRASAAPAPAFALTAPAVALSAPADAPAPEPGPAPGAAPADAPGYVRRTLDFLGRIGRPFGARTEPGPAPEPRAAAPDFGELPSAPRSSDAQELDAAFSSVGLWGRVAPAAAAEIRQARSSRMSKAAFKEYVQNEAAAAFERIKAARGVSNIGMHYNLHGGQRRDYVGRGIRASMGDIALRYGGGDNNQKVYFFQTRDHHPFTALDASNGEILVLPSRMGFVLNFFDVDAPPILAGKAAGRIREHGAISMDFHGMAGIPYSAYLAPPIEVFNGSAKKALRIGRLTRDEETLATVRYIEAALLAGRDYIPR